MTVKISASRDYYKILGVAQDAKPQTIKKKYRALAREHHPDTNRGSKSSEEKFKLISEAYSILINTRKRKAYDQLRANGRRRRPPGTGSSAWGDPFDFGRKYQRRGPGESYQENARRTGFEEEPFIDPATPTRGFDLQFLVEIPLVLACLGGTLPYRYDKHVACAHCQATGKTADYATCPECEGTTRVVETARVDLNIPPGVQDQYTLRLANLGGAGRNGGPPGDLLIKVCIQPHPRFKRVKNDVYTEVTLPRELAEQGGTLEVETLDSVQTIEVEENTLTGEELRLPGAGAYEPWGKKRGDLIIKFRIQEP